MSDPSVAECIPESLVHPYVFFSREEMDLVRTMCLEGSHAEVYRQKRESLHEQLHKPFPVPPSRELSYRDGIWEEYSRLSATTRSLAMDYAFAYAIEENPMAIEEVERITKAAPKEMSWVFPEKHEGYESRLKNAGFKITSFTEIEGYKVHDSYVADVAAKHGMELHLRDFRIITQKPSNG